MNGVGSRKVVSFAKCFVGRVAHEAIRAFKYDEILNARIQTRIPSYKVTAEINI